MKVFIVDDDEMVWSRYKDLFHNDFPGTEVRTYETLAEAFNGLSNPDFLIIDVSAVTPGYGNEFLAYRPIARWSNEYPQATVIITSGMGRNATVDVVDEVNKLTGGRAIYGGWGEWGPVKEIIKKGIV